MSSDMVAALTITAVGFTTVFLVLIALSYCFSAMKVLAREKKDKPEPTAPLPGGNDTASAASMEADAEDARELAVVITAALAAFMDDAHVVTSIRRLEDTASWSRTGRHDQMVARHT